MDISILHSFSCLLNNLYPSSEFMRTRPCMPYSLSVQFSQWLSRVRLFVTPWIAARQASLSITNSRSSLRLTSIELVMPSSHLILCCPLLLLPPIRVFSSESALRMRWPKYWSFSFSIIPSKETQGLIRYFSSGNFTFPVNMAFDFSSFSKWYCCPFVLWRANCV